MPARRQTKRSAKAKTAAKKRRPEKTPKSAARLPVRSSKRSAERRRVHRWMNVMDIAALHPGAADVLAAYGLHCIGCAYSEFDTLEAGASAHGLTDDDITNILVDLERLLDSGEARPRTMEITAEAAKALLEVAKAEGKSGFKLRVTSDDAGGFCMEFTEESASGDLPFFHREVPELILIANTETLGRIGGSTIDFRDGRFKLDMPKASCACMNDKDCSCK